MIRKRRDNQRNSTIKERALSLLLSVFILIPQAKDKKKKTLNQQKPKKKAIDQKSTTHNHLKFHE